ncbi:MAG: hypothetical protein WKF37_01220 [Bryobacteraceae bacterium]
MPGGTLDPRALLKYSVPLFILPAMLKAAILTAADGSAIDYYEIAVRQVMQQILPLPFASTTIWAYGSAAHPNTVSSPAYTIEASFGRHVRVEWINGLTRANGSFLPHLLPVDQTLHWANPPGPPDERGLNPQQYRGPVPMITHLHGGHAKQDSDGYPEAWYLPNANNLSAFVKFGTWYERFRAQAEQRLDQKWEPGTAVFQYANDQRATTLWYHDHTLGMTRVNIYAGLAGFYLLRGGLNDLEGDELPKPAPKLGDQPGTQYYEIPLMIQDRSFEANGSLFYPNNRAFFEGLNERDLRILTPMQGCRKHE